MIYALRKKNFLLLKKEKLYEVENKLNESNISNIFKERIIEIYFHQELLKDHYHQDHFEL